MNGLIGQTLGQYRIIEQIAVGGMTIVYRAYQPNLDRYVALKVLPPIHAEQPDFSERFPREAKAVAGLHHPNIVPVYDYGQEGDYSFIAMRYVEEAHTLKEVMETPLSLNQVADLIGQIAAALDHAHQRGVIHRDIKPSNVLIDGDWALLTDFGLAKMTEGWTKLTRSGATLGTPAYMSPEQGQGLPVDHRTDIYSLGIILFEMLTDQVPHDAETPFAIVLKRMTEPLPLPRAINPEIPEAMERVILKALAQAPEDRYQSAGEMAQALRGVTEVARGERLAGVEPGLGATPPPKQPTMARRPRKLATLLDRRNPWSWIAGLVALTLIAVALLLIRGGGGEGRPYLPPTDTPPTKVAAPVVLTDTPNPSTQPTQEPTAVPTLQPTATNTPTPTPTPTLSPGSPMTRPRDGATMVYVPGGTFQMGSSEVEIDAAFEQCEQERGSGECSKRWFEDESPQHEVTLDSFWVDKYEVTNARFAAFLNEQGNQQEGGVTWLDLGSGHCLIEQVGDEYQPKSGYADHPVIEVSWYGAKAYCEWAGGRLPTEAEWEYAARGLDENIYPWEDTFDGTRLNFCDANCTYDWKNTDYNDGYEKTAPVGSFENGASWCKALDMAGNVWEWTTSLYRDYPYRADDGRENPDASGDRVLRGGSWYYRSYYVRSAIRYHWHPHLRNVTGGLRCVGASTSLSP